MPRIVCTGCGHYRDNVETAVKQSKCNACLAEIRASHRLLNGETHSRKRGPRPKLRDTYVPAKRGPKPYLSPLVKKLLQRRSNLKDIRAIKQAEIKRLHDLPRSPTGEKDEH